MTAPLVRRRGITHSGGRKPKPEGTTARTVSVTLSADEYARAKVQATDAGISVPQVIAHAWRRSR